jgi:hypothetical protein
LWTTVVGHIRTIAERNPSVHFMKKAGINEAWRWAAQHDRVLNTCLTIFQRLAKRREIIRSWRQSGHVRRLSRRGEGLGDWHRHALSRQGISAESFLMRLT